MVNWLLLKHPKKLIKFQLNVIENSTVVPAQFSLFKKRVKEVQTLTGLRQGDRTTKLRDIVSRVMVDVKALAPLDPADPSTHATRDEQVQILQRAMKELYLIAPKALSKVDEDEAIQKDAQAFMLSTKTSVILPKDGEFLVHDMLDPTKAALQSPKFPVLETCRQVRKYLQTMGAAQYPDLWIRYCGMHTRTPEKLSWSCPRPGDEIKGHYLEFVDIARVLGDYIVVLKHQAAKDTPQPIDIARMGDPCCAKGCKHLQEHMQHIWPNHKIVGAVTIQEGSDVLTETFDAGLFDPRSNNLRVYLQ